MPSSLNNDRVSNNNETQKLTVSTSAKTNANKTNKTNPPDVSTAIGIDLGTTYSRVAVWQRGRLEIITGENGTTFVPSCVAFAENECFVGNVALDQMSNNAANTVFDLKRMIGRRWEEPVLQTDFDRWRFKVVQSGTNLCVEVNRNGVTQRISPQELESIILRRMKMSAESYLGSEVRDVVLTVPVYFNDAQRQATKEAGALAGLNVLRIINDPSAAAIAYGLNSSSRDERCENVLIFDLGGGTCDVSILSIRDGSSFEVKAIAGDTHLGGRDFDSRLLDYLVSNFERMHSVTLASNSPALHHLRVAVEQAKHTLSSNTEAVIEINALSNNIDFKARVSRAKFVDLCVDLFRSAMLLVDRAMTDARMDKASIDEIILVGGSTRIPKIRSLLQSYFNGKKLNYSVNSDEVVVKGAALQAAILKGAAGKDCSLQDFLLIDVTPLSLGIETAGGLMTILIKRNSPIPCRQFRMFTTSTDNQSGVTIKVYEGDCTLTQENNLLGKFQLTGIPQAARGEPRIEVLFELDANGILSVTANDRSYSSSNEIKILRDGEQFHCDEISRMLKKAVIHESEDLEKVERWSSQRTLENYVLFVKQILREKRKDIPKEDFDLLDTLSEEAFRWIVDDRQSKNACVARLEFLTKQCSPVIARIQRTTTRQAKRMRH